MVGHITQGYSAKLRSRLESPVHYEWPLSQRALSLNSLIGRVITIEYTGAMQCVQCGRSIKKNFQQGYCYPCYQRLMECRLCTIHPARCRVEEGHCDPNDWAHAQCARPHIVYLANTSQPKVGITQQRNIPMRWIDQGAIEALPIFKTCNRYQAGFIENVCKAHLSDRTHWRSMLSSEVQPVDLLAVRDGLLKALGTALTQAIEQFPVRAIELVREEVPVTIHYPSQQFPDKLTSLSLEKTPRIESRLLGIKGQYLILECGVLNVRKHGGYEIALSTG